MYRYRAFGLSLLSAIEISELAEDTNPDSTIDIEIVETSVGYEILPMGEGPVRFEYGDPRGLTMIWPGAAAIRVVGPNLIEMERFPNVPESYLPFALLGPVIAWVLHLRKFLVLHASSVCFHGRSISFLGDKLAGKSTTAAAFLAAGAELLTDDLLAIDMSGEVPLIRPAFPQLKLSDDAAENVQISGSTRLPLVMDGFEKRQYRLPSMQYSSQSCDFIFVLKRGGNGPAVEWLDSGESLINLMRYSYNIRFGNAPVEMQDRARYFMQYGRLAQNARVGCLLVPPDLKRLQDVTEFVKNHILTLTQ